MQVWKRGYLVGLAHEVLFERLAHYYCEINVLHPFRLGAGWRSASSLNNWRYMRAMR